MDYKKAGVDIAKGDALVDWLKSSTTVNGPHSNRVLSGIGGFAAMFKGDFPSMEEPILVSSTDGIGTKVKLAAQYSQYEGVGQDLVAMCVNDLICCGAQPLFFLDYYATSKLDLDSAQMFLKGVRQACTESDCALIGGETAEMPGVYQPGEFDAAGFCVGVVDGKKVIGAHKVGDGDRLLGVASSGFHSNGYSLIRKLFESDLDQWVQRLLEPTSLYVKLSMSLLSSTSVSAIAHITGGGIDNLLRVLPEGANAKVKPWDLPDLFLEAQKRSGLVRAELLKTFNCGIGLVIVVPPSSWDSAVAQVETLGFGYYDLGFVEMGSHSGPPKLSISDF